VINVYDYFKKQFPDKIDNYIVDKTCNATCTRRASFYKIRKEAAHAALRTSENHRKVTYRTNKKELAKNMPFPDDSLKRELLQTVDSVSTLRVLLTKWQSKEV
jgi:hypothetical protein